MYVFVLKDDTNVFIVLFLATIKINSQSTSKEACLKDNWHSIINYIENYVNMTMKSTINIYDADKTGMVDYALESAGKYKFLNHFHYPY